MKKRKGWRRLGLLVGVLLLAVGVAGGAYVADYYHADAAAMEAMAVRTERQADNVTWFVPEEAVAGLIFYPGGKVEAAAYAPLLRLCAERGILCALVEMPARLAVLDSDAADGLQQAFPEVEAWYMAGHSLGGAMAAVYAADHAEDFAGVILLAAYATRPLTSLRVLSVYGTEDGVLNREAYAENWANLPEDTVEVVIEGGNHAQFGSYGAQDGDGVATVSGAEQLRQTAEAIAAFIG